MKREMFIYGLVLIIILSGCSKATSPSSIVPDDNFREAINVVLGQPADYEPTITDLNSIFGYVDANNANILSIEGAQYLTSLTGLSLSKNQLSDISVLSSLTNLNQLSLGHNQISDISALSSLTNITYLRLDRNQINDISAISGLMNLGYLELQGNQITDIFPLVENTDFGLGDGLFLNYYSTTNPLSQEAIEVHIPILQSRGFDFLVYPLVPNTNAACYPTPTRHENNVANNELSWQGSEFDTTYEVYLGLSNENLVNIGYGQFTSNNIFTFSPELLPDTEYWWRIKSTYEDEVLWSGMWHFTTGNYTAINNDTVDMPKDTILNAAYPNPFNPTTNISFVIKTDEIGILSIYNIKGEIITSKKFNSGLHNFQWNGDKYSSGVYFYKLETPRFSKVKKMLMLK